MFVLFLLAANSAAPPAVSETCLDIKNYEGMDNSDFPGDRIPFFQGMSESPSGRLSSERRRPAGSLVYGISADDKALQIGSFRVPCLAVVPGASLHARP